MPNIFIINNHEYYPFSEGRLNNTLAEKAVETLSANGHEVKTTTMKDDYDVATEVQKHQWADVNEHFSGVSRDEQELQSAL